MLNRLRRSTAALLLALAALLPISGPSYAVDDIQDYSTTAGSNTNVGGVSTAEGQLPGLLNDAIRALIAQLKRAVANQGADIASATTTAICATGTSVYAKVTGTTTITGLGTASAGCIRFITFTGALTLTHNATSLILPGAANITTAAGDTMTAVSEGSGNWRVLSYDRTPLIAPLTLTAASIGSLLNITNTDAGTLGASVTMYHNSISPAANDTLFRFVVNGNNSTPSLFTFGQFREILDDNTAASEDAHWELTTPVAGTSAIRAKVGAGVMVGATATDKGNGTLNADAGLYVAGHGTVAQQVQNTVATLQTSATTLPFDNTIPQNTEGAEFLSAAITPVNASSVLYIDVQTQVGASTTTTATCALFVDTTANALAAAGESLDATTVRTIKFTHAVSAASTSARTYKVRCGLNSGTVSLNGTNGTQVYGGVASSSLVVTEVLPQ